MANSLRHSNRSKLYRMRRAILKILRELVSQDVRAIRELLQAPPGESDQRQD